MIPKIIHYCWFGGNPLGEQEKKYMDTWKNIVRIMRSNVGMNQRSTFQNSVLI